MSDDLYSRLREFMDRMPGGFPATETGVEIRLLKKLFTPEEAEMVMHLNSFPQPPSAVAARAGVSEAEAAERLESLALKGLCLRIRVNGQPLYIAVSFVLGIYEFTVATLDREMVELGEEYMPYIFKSWEPLKNKQMRVVPVGAAIEHAPVVETYDRIRDKVALQDNIVVAECVCRKEKGLADHECDRPRETCLMFGLVADYYLENGIGRRVSREEGLEIMDQAEKAALVLCTHNEQDLTNVCSCCGCCCGWLRSLKSYERPADHSLSSFQARIDPELCQSCDTCAERCQMNAIVTGEGASRVDPARCIGCGLCVPTCPENAVSLTARPDAVVPPANFIERSVRILAERGLA